MHRFTAILFLAASLGLAEGNLPVTPAESLSGQKLVFPTALAGMPAVCVFGFTKEAGDKTKIWMTKLSDDGIKAWSIAELEGAPGLVRGMIRSSMRKGTPVSLLDRSLIFTKDEKAWKSALGVTQEKIPVVVLFDASGRVEWKHEGEFSDDSLRELKSKLASHL